MYYDVICMSLQFDRKWQVTIESNPGSSQPLMNVVRGIDQMKSDEKGIDTTNLSASMDP